MSALIGNPLLLADDGYQISRSVRLRSSASGYFNRTPGSTTSRQIMTWSGWVKRGSLSDSGYMYLFGAYPGTSATDTIAFLNGTLRVWFNGSTSADLVTTQVFRDPSAWYHIVVAIDTTQATASNRIKVYVNGTQITAFSTASYPTQNYNTNWNVTSSSNQIGANGNGPQSYFDGYLTEINFVDGQALTPSSFGETDAVTGVWKPKKYTGTYGTNGFFLNFSDSSAASATTIGKDYSGNGNNWTPNNISVTSGATYDSMLDVPTLWADGGNGRGNYAVLNALNANRPTISDGNLRVAGGDRFALSTIGMTSGAWYAEMTVTTVGSETSCGIATLDNSSAGNNYVGSTSGSYGYYAGNGNKYSNASSAAYGASYTSGDVIGIAFDADAGTLTFYKNGTTQGTAYTGLTSGPYYFAVEGRSTGTANNVSINFGQRPFAYTPPTGFKALHTGNLPEPVIKKPNQWMDVSTWTGNGSARSITNSGSMQPDLVWVKSRTQAIAHRLVDAVRGAGNTLASNLTNAEFSDPQGVTSFNSNGFGIGTDTSYNQNGDTYVGWQWKANGTPAVTNTAGSITSTVSASTTAGFSVVTYTGTGANATVGHGLGVAPKMIIVKGRYASNWTVYHASLTNNTYYIILNSTAAQSNTAGTTYWNSTSPTSTVFSLGTDANVNSNTNNSVAYCFAEVAGFSRFGSYTGNGSADGVFVYLGFRARYILLKRTDAVEDWRIYDTARNTFNVLGEELYPHSSSAGASVTFADFMSNGFKIRNNGAGSNASGGTYIFAAFAENPFKYALAR